MNNRSDLITYFSPVSPSTPTLTSSNSASPLPNGTTVTLTCNTTSPGSVTYTFYKWGQEVPGSGPGSRYQVKRCNSSYTCTARINGVQSEHSNVIPLKFIGKF